MQNPKQASTAYVLFYQSTDNPEETTLRLQRKRKEPTDAYPSNSKHSGSAQHQPKDMLPYMGLSECDRQGVQASLCTSQWHEQTASDVNHSSQSTVSDDPIITGTHANLTIPSKEECKSLPAQL